MSTFSSSISRTFRLSKHVPKLFSSLKIFSSCSSDNRGGTVHCLASNERFHVRKSGNQGNAHLFGPLQIVASALTVTILRTVEIIHKLLPRKLIVVLLGQCIGWWTKMVD